MHTFKVEEKTRSQAIAELREKFAMVEEAIAHLSVKRKCVEDNASEVKAKVLKDITDVLSTLRSREVQLLRQIDVMEAHHLSILHTQYAELHQLLGNLRHVLYCVEHQKDVPARNFSSSEMEMVQAVLKQKVVPDTLTYLSDFDELNATIWNFGAVATNLSTLQATKDLISKCLPSKLEEYEDGDQQLLYKTLEEIKAKKDGGAKACLKFPKLSDNKEDWLRESTLPASQASPGKMEFCYPDGFLQTDSSYWLRKASSACTKPPPPPHNPKEKKVEEWLRQIQPMDVAQSELDSTYSEASGKALRGERRCSDASESIETISYPGSRTTSISTVSWVIAKPTPNVSQFTTDRTAYKDRKMDTDIENLHTFVCIGSGGGCCMEDNNQWLAKPNGCKQLPLEPSFEEMMRMGGVCRANVPCTNLSDCVCEEECKQRAFEKQAALGIDSTAVTEINAGDVSWLRDYYGSDAAAKKLRASSGSSQTEKMDLSEKKLKDDASNKSMSLLESFLEKSSWITSTVCEPSIGSDSHCICADFKSFFHPDNEDTWLVSAIV